LCFLYRTLHQPRNYKEGGFIDWKTNWKAYDIWDTMQIPLYAWAFMRLKDVSSVEGMLYFLRFRKKYRYSFSLDDGVKAKNWALELAMEIEEKLFLAEINPEAIGKLFPPKSSTHCKHCPFVMECYLKFK
jgi:hypothetical protein